MENRRHVRIPVHKVGAISIGPALPEITCSVTDISDDGAAVAEVAIAPWWRRRLA